jgi:NAD(P)-dependent dehydrogenase (short-subunit alcohol dehydrogenase family)
VVSLCRSEAKAKAAAQQIMAVAKGNAQVHAYAADLSKLREVKALAARVSKDHPSLAELINNAGVLLRLLSCCCRASACQAHG